MGSRGEVKASTDTKRVGWGGVRTVLGLLSSLLSSLSLLLIHLFISASSVQTKTASLSHH